MKKLVVTIISTLDGYAAGEGGNVFVMPIDLGFDRYNLERMRAAETMLFGAATFHAARNYWPPLADDDSAPQVEREISRLYNTLAKVVISNSTGPDDTLPWGRNTEIVRRGGTRPGRRAQGRPGRRHHLLRRLDHLERLARARPGRRAAHPGRAGRHRLRCTDVQPTGRGRADAARCRASGGIEVGRPTVRRHRSTSRSMIIRARAVERQQWSWPGRRRFIGDPPPAR